MGGTFTVAGFLAGFAYTHVGVSKAIATWTSANSGGGIASPVLFQAKSAVKVKVNKARCGEPG